MFLTLLGGIFTGGSSQIFAQSKSNNKAQAATQVTPTSLLWKVEGKGLTSASYVYGTMHSKNRSVYQFNESVIKSLESCQGFVGELALEPEAMMDAQKMMFMPEGKTLSKLLSKKEYELADKVVQQEMKVPLSAFDRMQPAFVLVAMTSADMMNGEMENALDQFLYNYAKDKGKKTGGLETITEQTSALGVMPLEKQVEYFTKGIKKFNKNKAQTIKAQDELLSMYLKTDVEGLAKMVENQKDEEMPEDMKTALVTNRNKTMADRFSDLIGKQSTFAAVGAAHLGGKDGIITLLRQKGYTVTAVPFKFDGTGMKYVESSKPKDIATTGNPANNSNSIAPNSPDNSNPTTKSFGEGSAKSDWVYYHSAEGEYTVLFPMKPTERKQNVGQGTEQTTAYLALIQEMASGKTLASFHSDGKEDIKPESLDEVFRKNIDEIAKPMNMSVINEQKVMMSGLEGKEFTMEAMGVLEMKVRMVPKGKRLYRLLTTYMKSDESSKQEALRFLESFSIK